MDLTTRRDDGAVAGECLNGEQVCRELVNGTEGCEVAGVTAEVPRKTSSFTIRNLVGGEDSERSADGITNANDGKFL